MRVFFFSGVLNVAVACLCKIPKKKANQKWASKLSIGGKLCSDWLHEKKELNVELIKRRIILITVAILAQGTTHGPMRSRRPFFIPQRFDSSCVSLMRGCTADAPNQKKLFTLLDLCVSSLRRGHANLLCIVPILTDDPRRESSRIMHCSAQFETI